MMTFCQIVLVEILQLILATKAMAPFKHLLLILTLAIFLSLSSAQKADDGESHKDFIVQLTPVVDGKQAKPFNISFSINQSEPLVHNLTLNSLNFYKNVSINLQLFAWYNGGWLNKKSRKIQITDRKHIVSEKERIMLRLMKYHSDEEDTQTPVILTTSNIYVSYDPEGSLMVAQLQDPELFIPNSAYFSNITKSLSKINVSLVFKAVPKTNAFIENRRSLSELGELRARVLEPVALIAHSFSKEMIEPSQIRDFLIKNLNSLAAQEKKIRQKINWLHHYKLGELFDESQFNKIEINKYLPALVSKLAEYKLTFNDNIVPSWRWILGQPEFVDRIDAIRQAILREQQAILTSVQMVPQMQKGAYLQNNVNLYAGWLWILVDLVSYFFIRSNIGLSSSYGTILNIWTMVRILSFAGRVMLSLHWLGGAFVFVVLVILNLLVVSYLQSKFKRNEHRGSAGDRKMTALMKNLLGLAIVVNVVLHLFETADITWISVLNEGFHVLKRVKVSPGLTLLCSFSELDMLIVEYYYVIAVIPQIVLNFRLKSVEKGILVRILLLGIIGYSRIYLWPLGQNWADKILCLKEVILCCVLVLQWLLFHNSPKIKLIDNNLEEGNKQACQSGQKKENKAEQSQAKLEQDKKDIKAS